MKYALGENSSDPTIHYDSQREEKMHKDAILITVREGLTTMNLRLVQDDPKLLDDGGEIPKSQGRGWQFDSRKSPLYLTGKFCQVVNCLLCFDIGFSAFCLK
jgi:hypothetical protein